MKISALLRSIAAISAAMLVIGLFCYAQDHPQRFSDKDRQVAHDYYMAHKDHPPVGLRDQDRLGDDLAAKLTVGIVLDSSWRAHEHPVPKELVAQLSPPPPHCRYILVGHHLCLIDSGNHVLDVFQVDVP